MRFTAQSLTALAVFFSLADSGNPAQNIKNPLCFASIISP
jgi:hypothetical protein